MVWQYKSAWVYVCIYSRKKALKAPVINKVLQNQTWGAYMCVCGGGGGREALFSISNLRLPYHTNWISAQLNSS